MMKVKLGDIGAILTGNTPKTSDGKNYISKDINFIKPSDIDEDKITNISTSDYFISELAKNDARILPVGSILVTCIGIIGKVGINSIECAFNQQINAIIPDTRKCNNKFLAYAIQFKKNELQQLANAPVVPILNKTQFSNIQICLPLIEKQNKIVAILDMINEIINKRQQQLKKLDELVKSRFIEMFGDPVTNSYNLPIVSLGELSELITKGASPSWQGFSYIDDRTQTLFITSENVREGYIDLSFPKYIEDGFNDKQKRSVIHKGDFLINIVGASIGRAAQFNLDCKANMNQAAALVRINDKRIKDNYLLIYLNSEKAQRMYDLMKSDTGRANLSLKDISDLSILLPPIAQQEKFEKFFALTNKSKLEIKKSLDKLEILKKSLMQEYFS